jgi:hypothetical protein
MMGSSLRAASVVVAVVAAVTVSAAMAVPPGYVRYSTPMGVAVASLTYGGDGGGYGCV